MNNFFRTACRALTRLGVGVLVVGLTGSPLALAATADDAPTKLQSNNYQIESMFFGNTGTIYSYSASIPPVITDGPTVDKITTTSASVLWTTDKNANSIVFFGTEKGKYTSQVGDLTSDNLTTTHEVSLERLTRGTTYYYKVRSVDADGNLIESDEHTFQSDPGDITPPVITQGPSISIDSASLVTITWETNELASTTVEYGTKNVSENSIGPADDLTLFHQVHISGLTPAQQYVWRVKTKDASSNITYSPTQQLATPTSPFISGYAISDITLTSAVVQWNTSTASTTILEMGTSSSHYDKTINDPTSSTNHIVRLSELQSGTTYYLKVSGVDQAGNQLQSDEKIFATVIVPQITDFAISDITADSATLTWHSSSQIDELLRYEITEDANPDFKGKKYSGGSDQLVTDHKYGLTDLESAATYAISVLGKDVFGNQAVSQTLTFKTLPDSTPPTILNVRSDTTADLGSRQTVQVLVSLELSELGKVVIEYGAGASGPYDKKVETDTQYSRAKFLVIPGLEPGQSYHFHILAKDRTGNLTTSPDYLVLAPAQAVSLLDLIFGQIKNNFGWLRNL